MYRFYRNDAVKGDVLHVLFDPEKEVTSYTDDGGDIVVLYSDKEIVGINIFNITSYYKQPLHNGAYLKEDKELLKAVNALLTSHGIPGIEPNASSGYRVAKIEKLEEHPLDEKASIVTLSMGDKKLGAVSRFTNLKVGEKVVVKEDGCLDFEGYPFHSHIEKNIPCDVEIVSTFELGIVSSPSHEAYVVDKEVGEDFFA